MKLAQSKGFTLVEILVVMVIMGVVVTAIVSLFQDTQKHAYTQDNTVDLQQNLRIAMDRITLDIQMAGFLIPSTTTPVIAAPNFLCRDLNTDGDCADAGEVGTLTLQSASPSITVAWPTAGVTIPADISGDEATFTVATAEMVDLFESGNAGHMVRIVRTPDHEERIAKEFLVINSNRNAKTLTLKGFDATDAADYLPGDLIFRHAGGTHPNSISYTLDNDGLLRRDDGNGAEVVAQNISDVELRYILKNGSQTLTVTNLASDPYENIRGIRVTLTGTTFDLNNRGDKTRQLTKLIALRNR